VAINSLPALDYDSTDLLSVANSTATFKFLHDGTNSAVIWAGQIGKVANPAALYVFLSNFNGSSANVGFEIFYDDRAASSQSDALRVQIAAGGSFAVQMAEQNAITPNAQAMIFANFDADNATAANRLKMAVNGGSLFGSNTLTNAPSGNNSLTDLRIGAGGVGFVGYKQEVVIYPSDQSSNRTGIEQNINAFYQMYWDGTQTGLLDTYPGAAAGYSLRALNSAYTSPLVRVRRASDNAEQDIYAKYNGELDIVALATFCAGTDGFVKTWYDQSGNAYDATQATSNLQDKIYDASTGVLLTNAKPSTTPQGFGGYVITGLTGNATTSVFEVIYANQNPTASLDSASTQGKYPYLGWNGQTTSVGRGTNFYLNGSAQSWANRNAVWQAINNQQIVLDYQLDTSDYSDFELRYGLNNTAYAPIRQETIIYFSDQSANRAGIETNINDYYSIY
jgi:hypothetical protein